MADRLSVDVEVVSIPADARVPGGRTNAYVVGRTEAALIDPADRTEPLDDAVAERDVEHLAVTHTHPDHVGAVAEYADELGATVWARAGREDRFEAATGLAPDRTFWEGTAVGPTTVVETPGHASDHVAFDVGAEAIVGDVARASGSVVIPHDGDVRAYLTTLRRLLVRDFARLHPGHGPTIDDPAATLERLLRHRLEREAQVAAAVRSGATTPDEVVDAVYDTDLGDFHGFALLTVRAHLRKLAVEGALEWDGSRARPRTTNGPRGDDR